jgi:hypothetical protein
MFSAACGYREKPASTSHDVSFTHQTDPGTTVTVYPAAHPIGHLDEPGVTRITSSQLIIRRTGPRVAAAVRGTPVAEGTCDHLRQVLIADPALHNVSVRELQFMQLDGRMTLVGVVPTLADKVEIEQKVREASAVQEVDNELEVWKGP